MKVIFGDATLKPGTRFKFHGRRFMVIVPTVVELTPPGTGHGGMNAVDLETGQLSLFGPDEVEVKRGALDA